MLTGTWVALGGVVQTGVAVFLTCKGAPDRPFKSLPIAIRILVVVTSPILLSPVVLNIYGAYFVIRYGITDMATTTIPMVIANLKFAEILIESAPQLATQWHTIALYPLEIELGPMQPFSIITSTLSIVVVIVKFVSRKRNRNLVSHQHPIIASLVPIALWILLSVGCGTVTVPTSMDFLQLNSTHNFCGMNKCLKHQKTKGTRCIVLPRKKL